MLELISIHIPKTAGKSFDAALRNIYGDQNVCWPQPVDLGWSLEILKKTPPEYLPSVISGHFTFHDISEIYFNTGAPLIAWLREPVERVISNYFFFIKRLRSGYNTAVNAHRWNEDLLTFAGMKENQNLMSKYLQGIKLEELFFFGFVEHLAQDMETLRVRMGWPEIKRVHINSSQSFQSQFTPVSPENLELLAEWNHKDVALYREACRLRGLGLENADPGKYRELYREKVRAKARARFFGLIPRGTIRRASDSIIISAARALGFNSLTTAQVSSLRQFGFHPVQMYAKAREYHANRPKEACMQPCAPMESTFPPRSGSSSKCPDFLIIGSMRCGINRFFRLLTKHPSICIPRSDNPDNPFKGSEYFTRNYLKGVDWFLSHYPEAKGLIGEAVGSYIVHPSVPERVHRSNPEVKLLMLFMDPVERAFSHYLYLLSMGKIGPHIPFEEKVGADLKEAKRLDLSRLHRDMQQNSIYRGLYGYQYRVWLNYFPAEQMLALKSEDFFAEPGRSLSTAFHFLGIPDHDISLPGKGFQALRQSMKPETRAVLQEFFRPHNSYLEECTGINWSYP